MSFPSRTLGRCFLLATSLCWAVDSVLFKVVVRTASAESAIFFRNVILSILGMVVVLVARQKRDSFRVSRSGWRAILFVTIASGVVADIGFYKSMSAVPVVNGLLIGHLQPFFMLLISHYWFRTGYLSLRQIFGGAVMFVASILVTSRTIEDLLAFRLGEFENLIILGCAIAWASSTVVMKQHLSHLALGTQIVYRFAGSLPFLALLAAMSPTGFVLNRYIVIDSFVIFAGISLYLLGLRALKAAEVGFLELFSPFFGLLLASFFLGEGVSVQQVVGATILLVGFYFLSVSKRDCLE